MQMPLRFVSRRSLCLPFLLLAMAASPARAGAPEARTPLVRLAVSRGLLAEIVTKPVSREESTFDWIDGVNIYGSDHLRLTPTLVFQDDSAHANLDLSVQAVLTAETYERFRTETIYRSAQAPVAGRKRILIDADGGTSSFATTNGYTLSSITGIGIGRGVHYPEQAYQNAWQTALNRQNDYDFATTQRAERYTSTWLDYHPLMSWLTGGLIPALLDELQLTPPEHRVSIYTSTERLFTEVLQIPALAPPVAGVIDGSASLALQVHQSALAKLADRFAGKTLSPGKEEGQIKALFAAIFGPAEAPQPTDGPAADDQGPVAHVSVTLAAQSPLSIVFDHNTIAVTVRLAQIVQYDHVYTARDISFRYAVRHTPDGLLLARDGKIDVVPAGYTPGAPLTLADRLIAGGVREALKNTLLEEIPLKAVFLPKQIANGKELDFQHLSAEDGWLSVALDEAPAPRRP